jgi:hypothetical protein
MGFWFRDWDRYDYIKVKLSTDPITQKGFAAWCILTFIVFTSFAPIRRWNYEIFVITHLITFTSFTACVWIHVPNEVKVWVWIPIGLVAFDRLMRARRVVWGNWSFGRYGQNFRIGNEATLTPLPGSITRISISDPLIEWNPGQHVFLSCHSVVPLQSHPFTIASLPSDRKMEFLVRAERGGTKRFLDFASKHHNLPLTVNQPARNTRTVFIEGPYGKMRPLRQFDTLIFFAGSTGATFATPLLRDVVEKWNDNSLKFYWLPKNVVRRIRFVWVIKAKDRLCWFQDQLDDVVKRVNAMVWPENEPRLKVEISVYITCDPMFIQDQVDVAPTSLQPISPHGRAEELPSSNTSREQLNQTAKGKEEVISIRSIRSTSSDAKPEAQSCGLDGTCCCTRTVSDDASSSIPNCTCNCDTSTPAPAAANPESTSLPTSPQLAPSLSNPTQSPTPPSSLSQSTPQHAFLTLRTGRPHPESIIRHSLEQALGETAVIVCGPRGLREEVRRSVVYLSDERAVHKGTGAQGVWLHSEGFEY